jgi:hypothetical protein
MKPNKPNQIVRFHSPLVDEDPNQLYVVVEIFFDVEKPRCIIKALGTGLTYPPTTTVLVEDLEICNN